MSKGGGSQTSTTTQKADPWEAIQPYMKDVYARGADWLGQEGPSFFPGSMVAGFAPESEEAMGGMTDFSRGAPAVPQMGQDLLAQGGGEVSRLLGGDYLNKNPYLDQMFADASGAVGEQFRDIVQPGITSRFGLSGRSGSGLESAAHGRSERQLADTLGSMASSIYGGDYARERQNMMSALPMASSFMGAERGELDAQRRDALSNLGLMSAVGGQREGKTQAQINEDINRWNYEENLPMQKLLQFNNLLSGGMNFGTTTSQQTQPLSSNPAMGALGGAMGGASIGNLLGMTNPLFAIGGGLLGAFS
ncbi:hypothetical protein KAR91_11695 [Candidatus Pacearchaeota archaeon]|nr:hypothetical protein [Candidatus Pacearchaeota archaeon]